MSDTPLFLQSGLLRLLFVKQGDRFAHRVEICRDPKEAAHVPIWESSDEPTSAIRSPVDWPASPPLQEVHLERRGDGRQIALAVGRAGKSHWSVSIEPFSAGSGFVFDVACRVHESPQWLGNSYRRVLNSSGAVTQNDSAEFDLSPEFEELTRLQIYPDRWIICPTELHGPLPRTIRWQYQIRG